MSFAVSPAILPYTSHQKLGLLEEGTNVERPNISRVALPGIGKIMREGGCYNLSSNPEKDLQTRAKLNVTTLSPSDGIYTVNNGANICHYHGQGYVTDPLNRTLNQTHDLRSDSTVNGHKFNCHSDGYQLTTAPCTTFSEMLREDVPFGFCYKTDDLFDPRTEESASIETRVQHEITSKDNTTNNIPHQAQMHNTSFENEHCISPTGSRVGCHDNAMEANCNAEKQSSQISLHFKKHPLQSSFSCPGTYSPMDVLTMENNVDSDSALPLKNEKLTTPRDDQLDEDGYEISSNILDDLDLTDINNSSMEKMEREYYNEAIKEVYFACSLLNLPPDPNLWTKQHVEKWVMWTVHQCRLPTFDVTVFRMPGTALCRMSERDMHKLAPSCGDILHARLEIWRSAVGSQTAPDDRFTEMGCESVPSNTGQHLLSKSITSKFNNDFALENATIVDKERHSTVGEPLSSVCALTPNYSSGIHLWQFLRELLLQPQSFSRSIRWVDRQRGIFKIEDSVEVARLWGVRKNRPAMNYDKLSRSIRQYYKKGIIRKTKVSQRLVYQFVEPINK